VVQPVVPRVVVQQGPQALLEQQALQRLFRRSLL
jgi:hypothetical protein